MRRTTRKLKRKVLKLRILASEQNELLHVARLDILHLARLVRENTKYISMLVQMKETNEVAALLINEGITDEPKD